MVSSSRLVQYRRMSSRAIFTPGRNWVSNQLESNETDALGTVLEPAVSSSSIHSRRLTSYKISICTMVPVWTLSVSKVVARAWGKCAKPRLVHCDISTQAGSVKSGSV